MTQLKEIVDEKTGKGTGRFEVKVDFPDTDPIPGIRPICPIRHSRR